MRSFTTSISFAILSVVFLLLSGDMTSLDLGPSAAPLLANAAIIPRGDMLGLRYSFARSGSGITPRHWNDSPAQVEGRDLELGEDIQGRDYHVATASDVWSRSADRRGDGEGERRQGGRYVVHKRIHPRDFRMKRFVIEE
ncbi:hypothetical protein NP233_g10001 [Leucocoprinus birnbaumii]|uniref:Uncharacterized protein n=1 Tax=Leucocoprinus birnbaumii TaxID=56174 RepID=A0AAD5VJD9_9AGAR|nr:hypothetical protein NP233_g10001 [Leucocoprinus birnbaumii]